MTYEVGRRDGLGRLSGPNHNELNLLPETRTAGPPYTHRLARGWICLYDREPNRQPYIVASSIRATSRDSNIEPNCSRNNF